MLLVAIGNGFSCRAVGWDVTREGWTALQEGDSSLAHALGFLLSFLLDTLEVVSKVLVMHSG